MYIIDEENIESTIYTSLELMKSNSNIVSTGRRTMKELSPVLIKVNNPLLREYLIPGRNNSIIATIAETLWVIGGKNDVEFLKPYLPRAGEFSEDGRTWRTGYGYRLQHHFGINQIFESYLELKRWNNTSQANMSLMDPKEDLSRTPSASPCTLSIHFTIREGKLNTFVNMRANDLIWGLSHVNFYEWSVISELIANWLNIEVGSYFHYTVSLRVYQRHYMLIDNILSKKKDTSLLNIYGKLDSLKIDIPFSTFEAEMERFFEIEKEIREVSELNYNAIIKKINSLNGNYLRNCLLIFLSYWLLKLNCSTQFAVVFSMIQQSSTKVALAYFYMNSNDSNIEIMKIIDEYLIVSTVI